MYIEKCKKMCNDMLKNFLSFLIKKSGYIPNIMRFPLNKDVDISKRLKYPCELSRITLKYNPLTIFKENIQFLFLNGHLEFGK